MEEENDHENEENDDENEEESANDDTSSDELEDNATYQEWRAQAIEATNDVWTEKYEKYIQAGVNEEDAKGKANIKTLWAVKRFFFNRYATVLTRIIELQNDNTHQEILDDIHEKIHKGINITTAIKRVLVQHRNKFDALFQEDEPGETIETDEDSDD